MQKWFNWTSGVGKKSDPTPSVLGIRLFATPTPQPWLVPGQVSFTPRRSFSIWNKTFIPYEKPACSCLRSVELTGFDASPCENAGFRAAVSFHSHVVGLQRQDRFVELNCVFSLLVVRYNHLLRRVNGIVTSSDRHCIRLGCSVCSNEGYQRLEVRIHRDVGYFNAWRICKHMQHENFQVQLGIEWIWFL